MADAQALSAQYTPGVASSKLIPDNSATERKVNGDLDKNAFLNLLMTQMKYQDPLNPVDDKEFLAQMAQFSALEQMQNMNQSATKTQAFSMIGKNVYGNSYNEVTHKYTEIAGKVNSVKMAGGETYLVVGDNDVEMNVKDVEYVLDDYQTANIWKTMSNNIFNTQSMAFVGKTVQVITYDKDQNANGFVEGEVDYIKFVDGIPFLVIGDKEIFPGDVISVADKKMVIGEKITAKVYNAETGEEDMIDGQITGIRVSKKEAYVQIKTATDDKEVPIDYINHITDGLRLVGYSATYNGKTDIVSEIYIKSKKVYVVIGEGADAVTVEYGKLKPNASDNKEEKKADADSKDTTGTEGSGTEDGGTE